MKANVGKAIGMEATPAEAMLGYVIEHVVALMTIGGIESLTAQRYMSGMGCRLHAQATFFKDAPDRIKMQGMVMKDALVQIMATANITKIEAMATEEEMSETRNAWARSVGKASGNAPGSMDMSVPCEPAGNGKGKAKAFRKSKGPKKAKVRRGVK